MNPVTLSKSELKQFVGDYGPRHILSESGGLIYQRDDRDPQPMIALGDDRFMFADLDYFRIQFERDNSGKVIRLVGLYDNGRIRQRS